MPMNCPHRATPLTLPYGGRVIGSGCFERTPDDVVPDFGLYAYEGWRPTWPAAFIEWTDFGLPADTEQGDPADRRRLRPREERPTRRGRMSRRQRAHRFHHRVHGDPGGYRADRRGRVDAGTLLLARDRHEGTGALGRGVRAGTTLATPPALATSEHPFVSDPLRTFTSARTSPLLRRSSGGGRLRTGGPPDANSPREVRPAPRPCAGPP